MKKNRPGVKLSVLCRPADVEAIEAILFGETTTLGVRRWTAGRRVLARQPHQVQTAWGPVEGKIGWLAGRSAPLRPRVRVLPPPGAGTSPAAGRGLRRGPAGLRSGRPQAAAAIFPGAMMAFPGLHDPSCWLVAGVALIAGLLMLRSSRYYARQKRESGPSRRGHRRECRRSGEEPGDVDRWEVQMHDTARDLSARLDSKLSMLQALVAEADRAAARLEAALARAAEPAPPDKPRASSPGVSLRMIRRIPT